MRGGAASRLVAVTVLAVGMLLAPARPVAADPAAPTDFRSRVVEVDPATPVIEVGVLGGDAFLRLAVRHGHEVVVLGYSGEPYLRFDADGAVYANVRSPAHYLNDDRQGEIDIPPEADHEADPSWEEIASSGEWAWHDHRIHWMGGPRVDREWAVELLVDGTPVAVRGELARQPAPNPLPPAVAGLGVLALLVALRNRSDLVALAATFASAVIALAVGWRQAAQTPAGAGDVTTTLLIALPAVAVLAAAAAVALRRRSPGMAQVLALAGVAAIAGWLLPRLSVLWKPVLPTDLPFWLDRAATAGVAAVVVAAAALLVLAPPRPAGATRSPSPDAAPPGSAP